MSTLKSINVIHPSGTVNNIVNDASGNVTVGGTITAATHIGGTTASSSLTLQSTSGVGTSDSILFKVGNNGATTAMTVNTSGNVGIGTSSPGNKLQVQATGTTQVRVGEATGTFYFDFGRDTTDGLFQFIGNQGAGYKWINASTEVMRIDSSGNVGIGTSSPGNKLVVYGGSIQQYRATGDNSLVVQTGDTSNNYTRYYNTSGVTDFGQGNGVGFISANGAQPLTISTNSAERMRIDSSGNVGIGTSSPTVKLDVNGIGRMRFVSGTGAGHFLDTTGNTSRFFVGTDASAEAWRIYDAVGGANRIYLDSSGNLGIGVAANASAILDAQSTTKGVRFPNMTTTQKNAVSSPAAGLVVFDTTLAKLCVYSGSAWQTITSI